MSAIKLDENKVLDIKESFEFVNLVVGLCYSQNGVYNPILKQFAFMYAMLEHYTDYKPTEHSVDEVWKLIYTPSKGNGRSIGDKITDMSMANRQVIDLQDAIDEIIAEKNRPYSLFETMSKYAEQQDWTKISEIISGLITDLSNDGGDVDDFIYENNVESISANGEKNADVLDEGK